MQADLGDHESLDFSGVWDMRTNTEVDHRAASVNRGRSTIGDFSLDEIFLVLVVLQSSVRE